MEGPQRVEAVCEGALAAMAAAFEGCPDSGSRGEWAAVVGAAQRVVNVATAVQDAAMARLAGIEVEWLEDGTEVERDRGPGHVALDAPAIVSGCSSACAGVTTGSSNDPAGGGTGRRRHRDVDRPHRPRALHRRGRRTHTYGAARHRHRHRPEHVWTH